MDVATFVVRLVEALAWPAVVGVAFWAVRGQIGGLVERIEQLKWPGGGASFFSQGLEKAEELAPPPPVLEAPKQLQERVIEAQLPPGYIVQQAWLRLLQAIEAATTRAGIAPPAGILSDRTLSLRSIRQSHQALVMGKLLSTEENQLFDQLRSLRNAAVLDPGSPLTITDALRFRDQAEALERRIEAAAVAAWPLPNDATAAC